MTTSGITSWPLTAEEIVKQACLELGAINAGEEPTGDEMNDGVLRLNAMLKSWQGDGNLFRETTGNVTVTANAASASAPSDCRDIATVRHVASSTNHRLLTEWMRSEYYSIPNRLQTSSSGPSVYYVQKAIDGLTIYVWPVPTTDITLELDYSKAAETVTDPSETVDVPEDWQEALIMGLASRMASMFGTTRIDPGTVARIDQRAAVLYQHLLDRDRPNSYYFEPDC